MIIKNGTVFTPEGAKKADIEFENGVITKIAPKLGGAGYDASGCLVFPGFIDAHTHFHMESCGTVTADELGLPVSRRPIVLPCGASGRWVP